MDRAVDRMWRRKEDMLVIAVCNVCMYVCMCVISGHAAGEARVPEAQRHQEHHRGGRHLHRQGELGRVG